MATSSRFAPINDHHITSYISELQTYLDQRRSQYRGPAEYTPMSDMELGGFNCSVTILDTSGTRYKVPSPIGRAYARKQLANGAAAQVALGMLRNGVVPPALAGESSWR